MPCVMYRALSQHRTALNRSTSEIQLVALSIQATEVGEANVSIAVNRRIISLREWS